MVLLKNKFNLEVGRGSSSFCLDYHLTVFPSNNWWGIPETDIEPPLINKLSLKNKRIVLFKNVLLNKIKF